MFELDAEIRRREITLKENEAKRTGLNAAQATIAGAFIALLSGVAGAFINSRSSQSIQHEQSESSLKIEQSRQAAAALLERQKFETSLILEAIKTTSRADAIRNLKFFVAAGFVSDRDGKISQLEDESLPSISAPSLSRTPCEIGGGRLTEYPADQTRGYSSAYLLIAPAPLASGASKPPGAGTLLVLPNNTGLPADDIEILRASATCALIDNYDIDGIELAKALGTPILVPLFPRPPELYLHALTRPSLETKEAGFARIDLQLIAMIDAARKELAARGQPVQPRVLMAGFGAAGAFTNRFTVLHPERVLAAAAGSPGGWPIAPVAADKGERLRYPIGIADAEELTGRAVDLAALRRTRLLFFLGDADTNDSVPYRDSFSATDADLINARFGKTPAARWGPAQELYHIAGINGAQFKLYRGAEHWVTPEMRKDIVDTFQAALAAP